ncbi:hypothetical protein Tco_0072332 [Tanacetum coccineum]
METPPPGLKSGRRSGGHVRGLRAEWDKYIQFWNDPKNLARAAQNQLNRQKSVVISRQGSRPPTLRSTLHSLTPSGKHILLTGYSLRMRTTAYMRRERLEATGEYTEDEINALARGGKLRGHIPGVGRVLPSRATSRPSMSAPVDKSLKSMHRKVDFMMSFSECDNKYADLFTEFEWAVLAGVVGLW